MSAVGETRHDPWVVDAIDRLKVDGIDPAAAPFPEDQAIGFPLIAAMSGRADGTILLGPDGSILFMNGAMVAILAADDGLALRNGALIARRPPESRRLDSLRGDVLGRHGLPAEAAGGQMLVSRRLAKRPYVVRVVPAPRIDRFFASRRIACIILVRDLSRDRVSPETLSQLFGLSPREADLAVALVQRGNLRRAAADAAMAVNTARNHLQQIFLKTGVNSQVALVALLSMLA